MKRVPLLHLALALWFLVPASCTTTSEGGPPNEPRRPPPKTVRTSELRDGALRLTFEPVAPDPALELLRLEEARALLTHLHASAAPRGKGKSRLRLMRASTGTGQAEPAQWEVRMRQEYLSRFGEALLPLPQSLETSRFSLALRLSPRYMGEGVREAARELFSSPVFLASVALSVGVYFAAWLAPEPLFTKAFVVALTLRLSLLVGALELTHLARACLRLYQQAEAARTVEQLEAAAEHFGRAMGGTALRALMLVASLGLSKTLPEVPEGGLRALLNAPRYAMPGGGPSLEGATAVTMAADGTVIVAGVAAGTAASAMGSACSDGSEKRDGYDWHHLATNKNDTSTLSGGPWTPKFEDLFKKAEMSLKASENLVYLKGHKGPHPEAYHQTVYKRLSDALKGCEPVLECKHKLVEALRKLANQACTPGSRLHQLLTKPQD
ncbi:AHH domain-containing protein [Archangium sp.]|uniref:AHH domain-containing protein n=1 Tax=Archangium sp. TaxID=1872627 RepID=UPI00286CA2D1|nr:AHH domain-containing protein [Archangium sp.]